MKLRKQKKHLQGVFFVLCVSRELWLLRDWVIICTMYWTYLLENKNDKSWYIGYTSDLKKKLKEHQSGIGAKTTKRKEGWGLIYCEGYLHIQDAKGRERFLKSGSGRKYIKKQLVHYLRT